jgi:hypothetical protein
LLQPDHLYCYTVLVSAFDDTPFDAVWPQTIIPFSTISQMANLEYNYRIAKVASPSPFLHKKSNRTKKTTQKRPSNERKKETTAKLKDTEQ